MNAEAILALTLSLIDQGVKAYALYQKLKTENRVATDEEKAALFGNNAAAQAAAEAEIARRGG